MQLSDGKDTRMHPMQAHSSANLLHSRKYSPRPHSRVRVQRRPGRISDQRIGPVDAADAHSDHCLTSSDIVQ